MILENGGEDLETFNIGNPMEALKILEQICSSLALAEKNYHFEHRDLHWGNIVLKRLGNNVKCSIIDFTFSRLTRKRMVFFRPYLEEEYFSGTGDPQFDVYRTMRDLIGDKWANYYPKTNVYWIHYLVGKLILKIKMKKKSPIIKKLKYFEKRVLKYESAEKLLNDEIFNRNT